MKFAALFVCLIFASYVLKAQEDFRPGYVIILNGDTLMGQIDYRGDLAMGEVCNFRSKPDSEKIQYQPSEIKGYRFTNSKYFISKELDGQKKFFEYLIKGKLNIYYRKDRGGNHYYLDKEGIGLVELPYYHSTKDIDGKRYSTTSTKHIGILNYHLKDAPELRPKISNLGKPEHRNLVRLAEQYNNIVCKDTGCIIYEKEDPKLFSLEFVMGVINFIETEGALVNNVFFQPGVIARIGIPRTSEKLAFRTGLLYTNVKLTTDSRRGIFRIPIQLEYTYPIGGVQPRIAYGLSLFSPPFILNGGTTAGIDLLVEKNLTFSLNYDLDTQNTFLLLPIGVVSQTFYIGFKFRP